MSNAAHVLTIKLAHHSMDTIWWSGRFKGQQFGSIFNTCLNQILHGQQVRTLRAGHIQPAMPRHLHSTLKNCQRAVRCREICQNNINKYWSYDILYLPGSIGVKDSVLNCYPRANSLGQHQFNSTLYFPLLRGYWIVYIYSNLRTVSEQVRTSHYTRPNNNNNNNNNFI